MKRIRLNRSATASTIIIIKLLLKISIFSVEFEFDEQSPFIVYIFYITTLKANGQHKIIESIQL
jgi:hypothetical protein